MKFEEFYKSEKFNKIVKALGASIILLLVFCAGIFVGLEKARYSYKWSENYFRNFAQGKPPFMDEAYMNPHGFTGKIFKIDGDSLFITSEDGTEKNVITDEKTIIRKGREDIGLSGFKTGDDIIIIGSPNENGQVEAKIIRIMNPNFPPFFPLPPPNNIFNGNK